MTPLIEVTELGFPNNNRVFAKCENRNPLSNSHYDRIYDYLFDKCIARKIITKSTHLFESSSGNAGTSFARFCELYGFSGTVVFPKTVGKKRVESTGSRHVGVVVSDRDEYMIGARETMIALVKSARTAGEDVHIMNHSQLWDSVIAMKTCGREIVREFERLQLTPDVFVSALGNGTSTSGIGLPLKTAHSALQIVGFEPASAPVYSLKFGKVASSSFSVTQLTGTGVWGIPFPNLDPNLLRDIIIVDDHDCGMERCRSYISRVRELFGESIGYTSAAALCVAHSLSERMFSKNIVTAFYDIQEYYQY